MKEKGERTIVVYIAPRQTGLARLPDAHDDTTCGMKTSCVFAWESLATAGNHLVEFFLFTDNSHNNAVLHCIQLKSRHLNSLFYFRPDGPAKLRCIQTEYTSANTNHHSVTDLSHLLVIVLDETSSVQPDNYSNHALHKTMTRKYPHVLPAEHQTQLLRSHPALTVCTDVAFTRLR